MKVRRWAVTTWRWRARASCSTEHNIHFRPGVNEDLAATAVFGSQIYRRRWARAKWMACVGIWYGKGPGVDRSGDIFRHANLVGHRQEWRRAAAVRRRSIFRRAPPSRIQSDFSLYNYRHSVSVSRQRAGDPRLRPARHRALALLGRLGRHEDGHRRLRRRRHRGTRSRSGRRSASRRATSSTPTSRIVAPIHARRSNTKSTSAA